MTEGEKRRLFIFNKFADNLDLLIENGVVTEFQKEFNRVYICPICKNQFSQEALNQNSENPLTLEDSPPKTLGGKSNILTCRRCNNYCGQNIDWHLTERMREMDKEEFIPNSEFEAQIEHEGVIVQGKISIGENGEIKVRHKEKKNNPSKLKAYIESIIPDKILELINYKKEIDLFRMQLAILKAGFILTFSKYGYAFILHPTYDRIREQLLKPEAQTYPTDFWFLLPFPEEHHGVPFLINEGTEAIFPIFSLTTQFSKRTFAMVIPLIDSSIEETINRIKHLDQQPEPFSPHIDPMGPDVDYLSNTDAIMQMLSWMKDKSNTQ